MTAGNRDKSNGGEEKQQQIPNLTEAWKKIYFESEEALARAIDDYVAGQSFTDFLEKMGSQYLSVFKTTSQNMDRFFANNPIPTKKDMARVAELVVAVEEKVDNLESDLAANMSALAANLIKLVDFQMVLKDELLAMRQDIKSMREQMPPIQAEKDGKTAAAVKQNPARPRSPQGQADITAEKKKSISSRQNKNDLPAEAPVRPQKRSKQAADKKV